MNDLEQRLARELGSLATDLDAPHVDTPGLAAAGRRERVRRRSVVAGLAAAAVAVVAVLGQTGLPGGHDRAVDPAPAPAGDALGRPLELPWWGADDGQLHLGDAQVAVDATAILHAGRTTLVRTDPGAWVRVDRGGPNPLGDGPVSGTPVIGADGTVAWVEGDPETGWSVVVSSATGGSALSLPPDAEGSTAVGVLPDGRVVLRSADATELSTWDPDGQRIRPVTGLSAEAQVGLIGPRPGGLVAPSPQTLVAGEVDDRNRFRALWETDGDGSGAWSGDGEQYAEAAAGGIRIATRAGATVVPLEQGDLRVVGWESDSEVVVAQYLAEDEAVTGIWRCSVVELRCALVEPSQPGTDAFVPGGRVLLPGL